MRKSRLTLQDELCANVFLRNTSYIDGAMERFVDQGEHNMALQSLQQTLLFLNIYLSVLFA